MDVRYGKPFDMRSIFSRTAFLPNIARTFYLMVEVNVIQQRLRITLFSATLAMDCLLCCREQDLLSESAIRQTINVPSHSVYLPFTRN